MPGRLAVGKLPSQVGDGDLGAVAQAHFGKDRADVVAHGAFAHVCRGGDLLVVESAGDELGDFELAVGQAGEGCGPVGRARLDVRSVKIDVLDALPSSTRLPSMTCVNAGGMAATSVLIK